MPKRLSLILNSFPLIFRSQTGQSSVYIILLIIIVIFAVMMAGGGKSLFTGNEASSITTPTLASDVTPTATPSATLSPINNLPWKMTVTLDNCVPGKSPYKTGRVKIDGPTSATVELISGTTTVGSQTFTPPYGDFPITLGNDAGFNTNNWKINVTSGGVVQKDYKGLPTGCI